jgi:hypothetical protein
MRMTVHGDAVLIRSITDEPLARGVPAITNGCVM